jgi:hypothetical protein
MLGSQPSFSWMSVLSLLRPRTPWGAERSYLRVSVTPAMSSTMSTSWFTVTSSLLPRLIGSTKSPSRIICVPFTQSPIH